MACVATMKVLRPDKDSGVCKALQQQGDATCRTGAVPWLGWLQLMLVEGCALGGWGGTKSFCTCCLLGTKATADRVASTKEKHVENRQGKGKAGGKVGTAGE